MRVLASLIEVLTLSVLGTAIELDLVWIVYENKLTKYDIYSTELFSRPEIRSEDFLLLMQS